jgi:isopenicillin-N N-acyltransferase-like protein
MRIRPALRVAWIVALCLGSGTVSAGEPFRFPEGRHGKGELRYIHGLPVLTVRGSREEMGEQIGVLALKPAGALVEHFREYLEQKGWDVIYPVIFAAADALYQRFPHEYRREMETMIKAAGADRNLIVLGNTAFDLQKLVGCSGLLVSAGRSATGGPLYGRNFDFLFDDLIAEYSLVVVYRPEGKKAFAMVTFPGLLASNCGMNEDGLILGANTVKKTGDGAPPFDPEGMPYSVAAREVMENCSSVEEFDRWIRGHSRTGMGLLLTSDSQRQRIYEITTRNIGVREPDAGLLFCTNHFRQVPMATNSRCKRYAQLEKSRSLKELSVRDVARLMDDVNQGKRTIQTMVFEPDKLALHLSIGRGPTSAKPLKALDLKPLLRGMITQTESGSPTQ